MVSASSPDLAPDAIPRRLTRDVRLRPLGLGFVDPALEAAWWARYARERARVVQGNIAILYVISGSFGLVDRLLFPAQARTLLALRAAMVAIMLLPAPWIFGRRSLRFLERHAQHALLYLTVVALVSFFAMGWVVLREVDELLLLVTLLCALFLQVCIYCTSGLRFAYAAPVGGVATGAFFAMVAARAAVSREDLLTVAAFLAGELLIGLAVCFTLEAMARRDFLRGLSLEDASRRTEALLLNLIPASFAARLKEGQTVLERLPRATIVFATLIGFDEATRDLSPVAAVRLLDRLVAQFDRIARAHGIERIKTVGATYMAAAGVPSGRDDDGPAAARAVLEMRETVRDMARRASLPLRLRAGIASGPVVAGVIGRTRMAFDCWGDTANLASRLDSHGEPDRIQLAPSTAHLLSGAFAVTPRGRVAIKGKGEMQTAWLEGER
jgi:class 3 adenylate cyclase